MQNNSFFSTMAPLNQVALFLFIVGKIFGMIGVSMGFCGIYYHKLGGYSLVMAFVCIFSAVGCSLIQTKKDKKIFEAEDAEMLKRKNLTRLKLELENEVKMLQEKKERLQKILLTKS